ncbi:MAG: adenylyltransferase/cytidyltransferase family protein [Clostridiales Family XIII bacterium]|jgi:glycerol-3-phosphate cytidylyltransferase|nr:adenylyltransferase/cytidyltransferase family protein [Clostridiales Family XIII bacterium]
MKKVITYGTFDLFHKGHRSIIERAKAMGDYLIVAVTGENYDHERGKLNVHDSLLTRIENIKATGLADEIIVEEYQGQKLSDIREYGIDTLVVGSDWTGKFDYLKKYCDVFYLERTKDVSSTELREKTSDIRRIGILTDEKDDGGIVSESRFVSGLEVVSVFAEDGAIAESVKDQTELSDAYRAGEEQLFWAASDIIYIHTDVAKRHEYAKRALKKKKHVIIDFPVAGKKELVDLFQIAEANGVSITARIQLPYLRTFRQLISLIHAGLIGNIVRVDCIIPQAFSLADTAAQSLFAATKILGSKFTEIRHDHVSDSNSLTLDRITAVYPDAIASVEISSSDWTEGNMNILGTSGRILVPDNWWNMAYFKAYIQGETYPKHYSGSAEGTGFRYLLLDLLLSLNDGRTESTGLTKQESLRLMEVLEEANLV